MFRINAVRFALISFVSAGLLMTSCKKKDEETDPVITEEEQSFTISSFRATKVDYALLTSSTGYNNDYFEDADGDSTVDRRDGQYLLRMINALVAEARKGTTAEVSAALLDKMYYNVDAPFTGTGSSELNASPLSIYKITATSKPFYYRDQITDGFISYFHGQDIASDSFAVTAAQNKAGVLANGASKYLVDTMGLELVQLIQKSMMGAVQIDYIGNYLLDEGLTADNSKLVSGKNYTELEHNWDMAFGLFSLNNVLYKDYTNDVAGPVREGMIGSYVWEYNKSAYAQMHLAFLKGRAAIINGDGATLKAQADFIRKAMEYAVANAGVGYLKKWSANTTTTEAGKAIRAHAIGEGAGFINSLRFCYLYGSDDAFSDAQFATLGLFTGNGFWDLTAVKVSTAQNAIKSKFSIVE